MAVEWQSHEYGGTTILIARDIAIITSDGTVVRANVYRPKSDTARSPTIVNMGPYGKDVPLSKLYPERWSRMVQQYPDVLSHSSGRLFAWEVPDAERWVPLGYVIVHVDARGTGASEGKWNPKSKREMQDFAECIDWIAEQSWSNGRVAVMGVSYYAIVAWKVAQVAPAALKAIIPWHGSADQYRDSSRHGGILSSFSDLWWYRWSREAGRVASGQGSEADIEQNWPKEVRARKFIDDWWTERSIDWSKVRIPFLSVGSWGTVGLHLRGNVEGFANAVSSQKWLYILAGKQGRLEQFHSDWGVKIQKRFLDRFLLDDETSWTDVPAVVTEVRLPGGGFRFRTDRTWPLASTSWLRLHLNAADRTLSTEAPSGQSSLGYYGLSDGVGFRTGAFAKESEITGPIALQLACATPNSDADLFVTLNVTDATGCRVNYHRVFEKAVTRGWLRLSHRETTAQSCEWRPFHSHARSLAVTPNEVYAVQIEILPSSFVVPAGGRIVLHIRGMDAADTEQTRHSDPDDRPLELANALMRLHTGGSHSSYLLLPVQEPAFTHPSELVGPASANASARAAAY